MPAPTPWSVARRGVLGVLAAVALATGCEGREEEEREKAAATVETFLSACAEGDATAAGELLTALAQRGFVRGETTVASCTEVLDPGSAPPDLEASSSVPSDLAAKEALEEATVREVTASGGFATVELELPLKRVTVPVERVRGVWLIADPEDPGFEEAG